MRTLAFCCLLLVGCAPSRPTTMSLSGELSVGTETIFIMDKDLRSGRREEEAFGRPNELPVWYLEGSEEAFKPVSEAVDRAASEGFPFAGMNLRVRFQGRPTDNKERLEIEVDRFDEVEVCPREPQTLHGCSSI